MRKRVTERMEGKGRATELELKARKVGFLKGRDDLELKLVELST